jgi:site-specific DNA recombinase
MKRAISYTRVSTESQATDGVSLDNQRDRIRAYADYRGFEIVAEIEDAGVSGGKNRAREGFMRLLDTAQSGEVQAIVLYSLDRLSRDMLTLLALERLMDEYDIEIHTIEGLVDTSSPDGWLNFAMKCLLGEHERRQIRYRTKRALEHKRGKGEVVGSIPYGYRREGDSLVREEDEQRIIEEANHLHSDGARLVDIMSALNSRGTMTRSGKPWTPQQVKRILAGYTDTFRKTTSPVADAARRFIEAVA